jgi:hypothetical protein
MKFAVFALVVFISQMAWIHSAVADDEKRIPAILSQEKIQFDYASPRSSYHCDFVRAETAAILRHLGAQDITVTCAGGYPYNRTNQVSAQFRSIRQTSEEKSTRKAMMTPVMLRFQGLCDLHERIVQELLVGFDVFEFSETGECNYSSGSRSFDLKTLK